MGEEKGGTDEMKGKVDNGWADRVKGMDREAGKENVKDEGRQRERGGAIEGSGKVLMMGREEEEEEGSLEAGLC